MDLHVSETVKRSTEFYCIQKTFENKTCSKLCMKWSDKKEILTQSNLLIIVILMQNVQPKAQSKFSAIKFYDNLLYERSSFGDCIGWSEKRYSVAMHRVHLMSYVA